MRIALSLKPSSKEAKENGCTCPGELEIDRDCPVHFPLYYIDMVEWLEGFIKKTTNNEYYFFIILVVLLALNLITTILK